MKKISGIQAAKRRPRRFLPKTVSVMSPRWSRISGS
jgi:hypothetical protein